MGLLVDTADAVARGEPDVQLDASENHELGRLAATTLAVVGQVYLVVFVAMIVGLRAQEWRSDNSGVMLPPRDGLMAEAQANEPAAERAVVEAAEDDPAAHDSDRG